jgi:hypothetical protein
VSRRSKTKWKLVRLPSRTAHHLLTSFQKDIISIPTIPVSLTNSPSRDPASSLIALNGTTSRWVVPPPVKSTYQVALPPLPPAQVPTLNQTYPSFSLFSYPPKSSSSPHPSHIINPSASPSSILTLSHSSSTSPIPSLTPTQLTSNTLDSGKRELTCSLLSHRTSQLLSMPSRISSNLAQARNGRSAWTESNLLSKLE